MDTFQQMVADILNKAQVEKDEGSEAQALLKILIIVEGPCQICPFLFIIFFIVILAQTVLKADFYFYFFRSNTLYVWISFSIEGL